MNSVVLIGRLTRDPELRFVPATGMVSNKTFISRRQRKCLEKKTTSKLSQGKPTADFNKYYCFW